MDSLGEKSKRVTRTEKILNGTVIVIIIALAGFSFQMYEILTDDSKFDILENRIDHALVRLQICELSDNQREETKSLLTDSKDMLKIFEDYEKAVEIWDESKIVFADCLSKPYYKVEYPDRNQTAIVEIPETKDVTDLDLSLLTIIIITLVVAIIILLIIRYKISEVYFMAYEVEEKRSSQPIG